YLVARPHVPQAGCAVEAGRHQALTVGTEGDAIHAALVSSQLPERGAADRVPESCRPIGAARRDQPSVATDSGIENGVFMAAQHSRRPRLQFVDACSGVLARRDDAPAIRTETGTGHRAILR